MDASTFFLVIGLVVMALIIVPLALINLIIALMEE